MKIVSYRKTVFFLLLFILSLFFLYKHNVEKKLTNEDIEYIKLFIKDLELDQINFEKNSIEQEIIFVNNIHKKILASIVDRRGIDLNNSREPKDLYTSRRGECFDISRLLEKIYMYYGYKVRHLSIYEKKGKYPFINLFFKKNNDSHAISQIFTQYGWISIDSVFNWIGIDDNYNLIKLENIKNINNWKYDQPHHIFEKDFYVIYGLYSRHGLFYPPYNRFPDLNFFDFLKYNFLKW